MPRIFCAFVILVGCSGCVHQIIEYDRKQTVQERLVPIEAISLTDHNLALRVKAFYNERIDFGDDEFRYLLLPSERIRRSMAQVSEAGDQRLLVVNSWDMRPSSHDHGSRLIPSTFGPINRNNEATDEIEKKISKVYNLGEPVPFRTDQLEGDIVFSKEMQITGTRSRKTMKGITFQILTTPIRMIMLPYAFLQVLNGDAMKRTMPYKHQSAQ